MMQPGIVGASRLKRDATNPDKLHVRKLAGNLNKGVESLARLNLTITDHDEFFSVQPQLAAAAHFFGFAIPILASIN